MRQRCCTIGYVVDQPNPLPGGPITRHRDFMSTGTNPRHCEERQRRSNPVFLFAVGWIASLALAMTAERSALVAGSGPLVETSFRGASRTRNLEIPGLVLRTIPE